MDNLTEVREILEAHPTLTLRFFGASNEPGQPRPRITSNPPAPLMAVFDGPYVEGYGQARAIASISEHEHETLAELYSPREIADRLLREAEEGLDRLLRGKDDKTPPPGVMRFTSA